MCEYGRGPGGRKDGEEIEDEHKGVLHPSPKGSFHDCMTFNIQLIPACVKGGSGIVKRSFSNTTVDLVHWLKKTGVATICHNPSRLDIQALHSISYVYIDRLPPPFSSCILG